MKTLMTALICSLVYANVTQVVDHHRYRVEYAYCPDHVKASGRVTTYPAEITVYQGERELGVTQGDYVVGRRGKDRTRAYIREVLKR